MKSPILGLALSTVAFGASSIYLWTQLDAEREQADAVRKANAQLTAQIVELQKRRSEFAERQVPGPGGFGSAMTAHLTPSPPGATDGPPSAENRQVWTNINRAGPGGAPPPMPEAMLKMMRANMRAQNKRMYFDLQSKLGLTDEQTSDLLDLITEQRAAGFKGPRNQDPEATREYWEAQQARQKTEIEDLLGPAKATEFEEYQKTLASRSELMMISQQLEGVETPLTDSQRSRLLDALVAERERIPMPTFGDGTSSEDMQKQYNDWQSDYEKRVADAARGILTADQLNTYNEYQQWQHELRQQFATQGGPGGGPRMRGNAMFMPAMPVGTVSVTIDNGPSPTEKGTSSK
jgi:hypothetical protein